MCLTTIINKVSSCIVHALAWLVSEIHLNYFIIPISIVLTLISTYIISGILHIFGIHDNIENDKKILGLSSDDQKDKSEKSYNKRIKIY